MLAMFLRQKPRRHEINSYRPLHISRRKPSHSDRSSISIVKIPVPSYFSFTYDKLHDIFSFSLLSFGRLTHSSLKSLCPVGRGATSAVVLVGISSECKALKLMPSILLLPGTVYVPGSSLPQNAIAIAFETSRNSIARTPEIFASFKRHYSTANIPSIHTGAEWTVHRRPTTKPI
jgi:hypothetical protein